MPGRKSIKIINSNAINKIQGHVAVIGFKVLTRSVAMIKNDMLQWQNHCHLQGKRQQKLKKILEFHKNKQSQSYKNHAESISYTT